MKRYMIEDKLKAFGACLLLLFIFPYIISVFVKGADSGNENQGKAFYVKVKVPDTEEADGVTEVNWTEYLAGVIAQYVPKDFEEEAMEALAVIIRTQLYREADRSEDKILTQSWMTKEEIEQKYAEDDIFSIYKKYTDAVEKTDDMVLIYNDQYAWTPFHQSSAGRTRSASEVFGTEEYPYILAKDCPLDKESDDEIQVFTFTYKEIQQMCRDFLTAAQNGQQAESGYSFSDFEIISCDSGGYVSEMRIGETICSGDRFRDALKLPSAAFSFAEGEPVAEGEMPDEAQIKITTIGKGHGLGMSLWTADQMALQGKKCEEILAFFFEGTEIRNNIPETELF